MKWFGMVGSGCLIAALLVAGTHPGSGAELPDASDTIAPNQFVFDPVSVESPSARIRLTRLGSYRGGGLATTPRHPPSMTEGPRGCSWGP